MRRKIDPPRCEIFSDCIANKKGYCMILTDNTFKRDCPFYKPKKGAKHEKL